MAKKRLTPKMKAHNKMMDLAQEMFGHNIRFAGFCIAYNYDQTSLAKVLEVTASLQKEKDNK